MIISGMGELHLEIIVDRLKHEFGVEANIGCPEVTYRETLCKAARDVEGKFVRHSGGKGHYGHVVLTLEPLEPGGGFVFEDATKGGVVPYPRRSAAGGDVWLLHRAALAAAGPRHLLQHGVRSLSSKRRHRRQPATLQRRHAERGGLLFPARYLAVRSGTVKPAIKLARAAFSFASCVNSRHSVASVWASVCAAVISCRVGQSGVSPIIARFASD